MSVPVEDQLVFYGTHEAIVSDETWQAAQRIFHPEMSSAPGKPSIFNSLMVCGECGTPMMEVTRQYWHTVYTISAFGSPESACTYEDRLLNLIKHEAEKSNGNMTLHQTAAQSATSASK